MGLNKKNLTFLFIFLNLIILINSFLQSTKFVYDGIIILVFLFLLYVYYEKLFFSKLTFVFVNILILIHHLGSFFYGKSFFGLEYDIYVHFLYGIIVSIYFYTFLSNKINFNKHKLDKSELFFFAIILVMGLSAIHELIEFSGALILGPGEGFLYFGSGDLGAFDTEWDLINGFLGSFIGGCLWSLLRRKRSTKKWAKYISKLEYWFTFIFDYILTYTLTFRLESKEWIYKRIKEGCRIVMLFLSPKNLMCLYENYLYSYLIQ